MLILLPWACLTTSFAGFAILFLQLFLTDTIEALRSPSHLSISSGQQKQNLFIRGLTGYRCSMVHFLFLVHEPHYFPNAFGPVAGFEGLSQHSRLLLRAFPLHCMNVESRLARVFIWLEVFWEPFTITAAFAAKSWVWRPGNECLKNQWILLFYSSHQNYINKMLL